eukprot:m51a1_g12672 putative pachytene checkpoint protein 2 homolog (421) ;mRNA; f:2755-4759
METHLTTDQGIPVEVCQKAQSTLRASELRDAVAARLSSAGAAAVAPGPLDVAPDALLRDNVEFARVAPDTLPAAAPGCDVHVFRLLDDPPAEDEFLADAGGGAGDTPACAVWELPSRQLEGLWESLHFGEAQVKQSLLAYVSAALRLSDLGVDPHVISWNRVVLLHGPPGTGKTSLAQALAHKLAVRLGARYAASQLVVVNSHSLFSKWFSESGKLVMKLFARIRELAEDDSCFVVVLIDEVESLSAARKSAAAGSEPSDAIRVVNALLTQLDQLKALRNVVVVATSNITGAIDLAFVDRADLKLYIGNPPLQARYEILASAARELARVGLVVPSGSVLEYKTLEMMAFAADAVTQPSLRVLEVARQCEGLSGRVLRKLPFLALALFLNSEACTLEQFTVALLSAAQHERTSRTDLSADK